MKVSTVNIITYADNTVLGVTSFKDGKKGNKEAEALFKTTIRELYTTKDVSDEEIEDCLDNGYFESGDYQIFIVHSNS